ncbi:beta-galactosidase trimerization domain-containing protein [Streptomyces sp. JJ66]|uniref:beta-galactosidase trimerization domain-containing protein n=1 Tax=Streptomyces sp. JJ66 TaxID=2803843 RepID=UPI001C58E815|nr:beta-galactosidase trimerization domain-containing protein [Streptomyces sp. JJ66]MBW1600722.1 beta-galactosidase trimerization domain-containing protein [Streptomyces sp. JJ66]
MSPRAVHRYTLQDGTFLRNGEPYFSVGFNYHPSSTGCDYWRDWDSEQLEADFARMAELGFNTVRFFVFWADFEPEPGVYDRTAIERMRAFASLAARHRLQLLPSLLTIWMNGQRFEPPWRAGRDLWRDPEMAERQVGFVRHVAATLYEAGDVLAYDLGDEVIHVDGAASGTLGPEAVRHWWGMLAEAVREAHPGALVLQANEASAVTGEHSFRPENADPLDLVGLHGFPVWTPFHMESVASPKASSFVPYLVRRGRAHRPVLVDEFGSYGCDEETARDYLRAAAHSALAAGACGVIVWCWQDFTTVRKPYALRPNERSVGLLRADGTPKPAMEAFQEFARRATGELAGFRKLPAPVGVHLLEHREEGDAGYLASGGSDAAAGFYAAQLLQRAHLPYAFTSRVPAAPDGPGGHRMVICPSVRHLTLADQQALADYVAAGGVLLYTGGDLLHGFGGEELFGVRTVDFTLRAADVDSFTWQGTHYPFVREPGQLPVLAATNATVLAAFRNGSPALTRHRYGQGVAYHLNAPFERQLNAPYRLQEAPWHRLYADIAAAEGVTDHYPAGPTVDSPEVEVTVLGRGDERCALVINHAPQPVRATLHHDGRSEPLDLGPKAVHLATWTERRKDHT